MSDIVITWQPGRPYVFLEEREPVGCGEERTASIVLYRIPMNILDMALKIDLIPEQMLPITPLPNTPLSSVFTQRV